MNLSLSEQLTYSTVRIECEYRDGRSVTGTGFFFQFLNNETNNTHVPVVITNKHVINNTIKGRLIFSKASENGAPLDNQHFQVNFDNFESMWIKHPDSNVDLCAMPLAPFLNKAAKINEKLFYIPLNKLLLPSQQQLEGLTCARHGAHLGGVSPL